MVASHPGYQVSPATRKPSPAERVRSRIRLAAYDTTCTSPGATAPVGMAASTMAVRGSKSAAWSACAASAREAAACTRWAKKNRGSTRAFSNIVYPAMFATRGSGSGERDST